MTRSSPLIGPQGGRLGADGLALAHLHPLRHLLLHCQVGGYKTSAPVSMFQTGESIETLLQINGGLTKVSALEIETFVPKTACPSKLSSKHDTGDLRKCFMDEETN